MRAGVAFVIAIVALAGLAIGDLAISSGLNRSGHDYGGIYSNEERAVFAQSVVMTPGDRLAISPNLAGGWPTVARYDFYIVNGADRFTLLDGQEPRVTYVKQLNTSLQGCCPNPWLAWDRPDDAFAHRQGATVVPTGPGLDPDFRAFETSLLDQPERIDLVWVLYYGDNVTQPSTPEERRVFESRLDEKMRSMSLGSPPVAPAYPTVYDASVVILHPLLTWTMAALALGATASLLWWALTLRKARFEPDGATTESLLRLYDAAGAYLASLRDILLGSLLVLMAVALHVALIGEPGAAYHLLKFADIGVGATRALSLALGMAYASVISVWVYAIWTVHRALTRWRLRRAHPPLHLATE